MNEIIVPKKLEPIVMAFFTDSPKEAEKLIIQAAKAIYGSNEDNNDLYSFRKKHEIRAEELEGICSLMQGIKPEDMLEALFAAQIVVSHMLGLRKLAKGHTEDQRFGLKMLKFSSDAISRLQKKRASGMQNITFNFNYTGTSLAIISTSASDPSVQE